MSKPIQYHVSTYDLWQKQYSNSKTLLTKKSIKQYVKDNLNNYTEIHITNSLDAIRLEFYYDHGKKQTRFK